MRVLTKESALSLIDAAGAYHRGEFELGPEIMAKRAEIAEATRQAELFMIRCGAVDEGMIYHVVELKLELDTLYLGWIARKKNITIRFEN